MNAPFEQAPLFTAEKCNEHPVLNECPPYTRKGALIWRFAVSAKALIQIICRMTKQEFSSVGYSLFFIIRKLIFRKTFRKSRKIKEILCFICYDMLTSTYFAFFKNWSSFKKTYKKKITTEVCALLLPPCSYLIGLDEKTI